MCPRGESAAAVRPGGQYRLYKLDHERRMMKHKNWHTLLSPTKLFLLFYYPISVFSKVLCGKSSERDPYRYTPGRNFKSEI
jgi:hypothetical protein